jgi:hypothetical protein
VVVNLTKNKLRARISVARIYRSEARPDGIYDTIINETVLIQRSVFTETPPQNGRIGAASTPTESLTRDVKEIWLASRNTTRVYDTALE